jgi:hypothetical protein
MRIPYLLLPLCTLFLIAGCVGITGHARNILVERDSGIISMPVTENSSQERANRDKARMLMENKCGKNFEITREEEVEVGLVEEMVANNVISGPSTKKLVKSKKAEYRLWYRCQ